MLIVLTFSPFTSAMIAQTKMHLRYIDIIVITVILKLNRYCSFAHEKKVIFNDLSKFDSTDVVDIKRQKTRSWHSCIQISEGD